MNNYFDFTHKIVLLDSAEKLALNPEIKIIWKSKAESLRQKRSQFLIEKVDAIRRRKSE